MQLWLDYFHNANPIYALNNRIAATAAANRLRPGPGLAILEIGAGAGSAAEALLDELAARGRLGDVAEYRITEPNGLLRRRAMRALAARFPGVPLADQAFDVDADAAEQGLAAGRYDLVLAVNVLHIARDLRAALGRARSLLAPGGWLVAGECLRLFPEQTIAVELVFEQLESFTDVELDPELRPAHGFLAPESWRRAFAAAGYDPVAVVPELERIRAHHPRFFTGAICGRRPPVPDSPA
jgi:SAM-dependent methyltransferase